MRPVPSPLRKRAWGRPPPLHLDEADIKTLDSYGEARVAFDSPWGSAEPVRVGAIRDELPLPVESSPFDGGLLAQRRISSRETVAQHRRLGAGARAPPRSQPQQQPPLLANGSSAWGRRAAVQRAAQEQWQRRAKEESTCGVRLARELANQVKAPVIFLMVALCLAAFLCEADFF